MPSTNAPNDLEIATATMTNAELDNDSHAGNDINDSWNSRADRSQVYYPSNHMGGQLRNAVSGIEYPHKRGSVEQLQYYQVIDTRGVIDNNGRRIRRNHDDDNSELSRDPNYLYYDSPEQYVQHCARRRADDGRHTSLSQEDISKWYALQDRLFPRVRDYVASDGSTMFKGRELDRDEYDRYMAEKSAVDPALVEAERHASANFTRTIKTYPDKGDRSRLGFGPEHGTQFIN